MKSIGICLNPARLREIAIGFDKVNADAAAASASAATYCCADHPDSFRFT